MFYHWKNQALFKKTFELLKEILGVLEDLIEGVFEIFLDEDFFDHLSESCVHELVGEIAAFTADIVEDDLWDDGKAAYFAVTLVEELCLDVVEDEFFDQNTLFDTCVTRFFAVFQESCPVPLRATRGVELKANVDIVECDLCDGNIVVEIAQNRSVDRDAVDPKGFCKGEPLWVIDGEFLNGECFKPKADIPNFDLNFQRFGEVRGCHIGELRPTDECENDSSQEGDRAEPGQTFEEHLHNSVNINKIF